MAFHRTITLDDISEGIYKEWRKDGLFNFSAWIRAKMLEDYNKGQTNLVEFERLVPRHYVCQVCMSTGEHYTKDCGHRADPLDGEEE